MDLWWAIGAALFGAMLLIIGPLQNHVPQIDAILTVASLALIAASVWRLRRGLPSRYTWPAMLLLGLGLLLLGAHQVPLPLTIWSAFPGRNVILETLAAAKIEPGSMPLSLDANATRAMVLYIMPSVALFFVSLSVSPDTRKAWAIVVVCVAVVCALLGLAQKFQGPESAFFLYPEVSDNSAKGTFLNRNFFAAQLYCTIPLVAALGVATFSGRSISRFVIVVMLAVYFIALMAALGASNSRGGLGLAMLAVLLSSGLAWSGRNKAAETSVARRWMFPVIILILLIVAQFGMVALLRVAQTDTASDMRPIMAATTLEAIKAYFPVGSGFGSFVPVYKLFENPEHLLPAYINNAHNDWLELALEGGLPMMILMLCFVIWFLAASFHIWRRGTNGCEDLLLRAASLIIFLLLLHSLFDYPLRTRAMMGIFAVCCGFLAYGVHLKPSRSRQRQNAGPQTVAHDQRTPRTTPYFARKVVADDAK
jgi:O-antigen ligase